MGPKKHKLRMFFHRSLVGKLVAGSLIKSNQSRDTPVNITVLYHILQMVCLWFEVAKREAGTAKRKVE